MLLKKDVTPDNFNIRLGICWYAKKRCTPRVKTDCRSLHLKPVFIQIVLPETWKIGPDVGYFVRI